MRLPLLFATFLFTHVALTQCINNGNVRPIENTWKIASVSLVRIHFKDSISSLRAAFALYRPYLDDCPSELSMMERRDCQWELSNAGVQCYNGQEMDVNLDPRDQVALGKAWFNCTGRVTPLLPGKWMKADPEQSWLKWRIAQFEEALTIQNVSQVPFQSITIEVVYGQR
jgi:hypothetical protein